MVVKPSHDRGQLLQSCGRIHDEPPIALCLATTSLIVPSHLFFRSTYERRTICGHTAFAGLGKIAGE